MSLSDSTIKFDYETCESAAWQEPLHGRTRTEQDLILARCWLYAWLIEPEALPANSRPVAAVDRETLGQTLIKIFDDVRQDERRRLGGN